MTMTINVPIIDNPQPQPGPSPTPSPKPCNALQIISITPASGGEGVLTFMFPVPPIQVDKDFMSLSPTVGDYYCVNGAYKWCATAADYAARFPQV